MTDDENTEHAEYIQRTIADATVDTARAQEEAAGLSQHAHPTMVLSNVHGRLLDAYANLVRAIDRVEVEMDNLDYDYAHPAPRTIVDEHADRLEEQYDGPVLHLALTLLEANRREWLHRKPDTNGAEAVERHGLVENQRRWLNDLQDAWDAYDPDDTEGDAC